MAKRWKGCWLRRSFAGIIAVIVRLPGSGWIRQRLAGKAGQQHIVRRYERRVLTKGPDIAGHDVVITVGKIQPVGLLGVPVPFAGEHTSPADALEAETQAADSGEQIDEAEGRPVDQSKARTGLGTRPQELAIEAGNAGTFPALVASDLAFAAPCLGSSLGNGKSGTLALSGNRSMVVVAHGGLRIDCVS